MVDTVRSGANTDGVGLASRRAIFAGGSAELFQKPPVLLLVVGSFLAVSTVIAKAAPLAGWHPLALLQWAIFGGAIGLFAINRAFAGSRRVDTAQGGAGRGRLIGYLVMSGLLFIAPNMIAVMAAPEVGAGFVSLSFAFPLVLTYAFAVLLRIERFQLLRVTGVLFGLTGGLLLAVSGADLSVEASWWSLVALLIPVFLATGNIFRTYYWPEGAKPVDLALGMMATGFLALAAFNAAMGISMVPQSWTPMATGLIAAQIAIFAVQYGLYFRLQQTAGPVYLSQIGSVAAVVGLGLGYAVFGEVPNAAKLAAVASVGAGIVLVSLGRRGR
ncbi:DMT family transporter [Roseibium sediminicola]|uniref:DMT family transporter n=1 Tax=Roseibium sediminicola TaxID=2933272 RepID=A0ABT0H117_9HYPH|nr:DMT family transporter [Roseibium sp. CAU 1639]MCK7614758.1 DMT family transporter [Roseibium sp. CAU 1639]